MKKKFIFSGVFLLLFIALILAVRFIDVAAVGPMETSIGLSSANKTVHDTLGVNMTWYDITEALGLFAIAVAAAFALVGAIQLIKRKSIFKVDGEILAVGCLYAAMAAVYVLFEILVINYRCIIMPEATEPEASFPSSHTMLVCVVMISAAILLNTYVKHKGLRLTLQIFACLMAAVTVVGRLLSGVHWLTDIIGGVLISACLIAAFTATADLIKAKLDRYNSK